MEVTVSDVLAWVRVQDNNWVRLGCWDSPCFGPFSLGARFESHEVFFYVILFIYDRGKPRITEPTDIESVDMRSHLNFDLNVFLLMIIRVI
jgi:hypothetical protein